MVVKLLLTLKTIRMKVILIQGKENSGKTTLCNQIDEWLQKGIFQDVNLKRVDVTKQCFKKQDFVAIYDVFAETADNKEVRILINSASDDNTSIDTFESFKNNCNEEYYKNKEVDILITTIRNNDKPKLQERIMEICDLAKKDFDQVPSIPIVIHKEDISKNKLMIELEKSPLHLIKEEIRTLLK